MSALPPKADMCGATRHVRFVPIADIGTPFDHPVPRRVSSAGGPVGATRVLEIIHSGTSRAT